MKTEEPIMNIDGVGEKIAEKLFEAGYNDLLSISASGTSELAEKVDIGSATALKIISAARKQLKLGFETADMIRERRKKVERLTTGSKELDTLIGGGVQTQAITEFHGRFGSGKTQLAFQLCASAMLKKKDGGFDSHCLVIDTENTFRPERIMQIGRELGLDPEKMLKNIHVARAYNSDHQILLAEEVQKIMSQNIPVKLIIVDSLTAHFRAEYAGRGALSERQQRLNRHLHLLQRLADTHNLAVVVTNQVMAMPNAMFGPQETAIGGNIVAHAATYRVKLRKGKGEQRIAKLIDSPDLPEGETVFKINESGIQDVK